MSKPKLPPEIQRIVEARHPDPFAVLGRHIKGDRATVRVLLPHAEDVSIAEGEPPHAPAGGHGPLRVGG